MDPIDFLLSLERLGMKVGLATMTRLCAALGNPERSFRSVIVAGTNGKGSVTAMLSSVLHAAGHRSGRYTSPHLERLEERFVVGEREVTRAELRGAAARVQEAVARLLQDGVLEEPPTFFECSTAIAFEIFRDARVETAVLEVGLGGRLDATNVVTPVLAAITSVDFDHQAQLGNTLTAIAREKAGVVRPGIPLVCGPVPDEADKAIAAVCAERGARLIRTREHVRACAMMRGGATVVTLASARRRLDNVTLALSGRHQAANAAVALGVIDELAALGMAVEDRAIVAGLAGMQWPGRLERFEWRGADVLIDSAHNPAGARALAEYLREAGWTGASLVFGAMRDKEIASMMAELLPLCTAVFCTTAPNPRAVAAAELAAIARGIPGAPPRIESIDAPEAALARACGGGRRVVAAGSIFVIGPLRGILRSRPEPRRTMD